MIETAISRATAPMFSPIGAWMRAMSASVACAFRRSPRLAWSFATERAIEAVALEGVQQRRIVDLGIVRHGDEGRVVVDVERRQRHVRPFRDQRHVRNRSASCNVRGSTIVTS